MVQKYLNFVRGITVNWMGKLGVVLTTSSFITFLILELARMAGIFTNQYTGLITYLLFPTLFVIGLLLMPVAWIRYKRKRGKTSTELLADRFGQHQLKESQKGSHLFQTIAILTLLNVLFLSVASVRTLHFMDQSKFCGTACHKVMNPEWVVYQDSPHARVQCVQCHVGEGVKALIDSKFEGARQMLLATFNLYDRPIPTPVHQLRPARETCEKCHWPDKFYGTRLRTIAHYADDETAIPHYTTLVLKIDTGKLGQKAGIHWHIAADNEVRYASLDHEREIMIWIEVRQPDGTYKRYVNRKIHEKQDHPTSYRTLDCVDCHNRATHIYEQPDDAVDQAMALNMIPASLPYIKRESVHALTINYPSQDQALRGLKDHLEGFYQRFYTQVASVHMDQIDLAISELQRIYKRNIHHEMNIEWSTYLSHLGHPSQTTGCYRCHNPDFRAADGSSINHDCTLCHSILAYEELEPFRYLLPASDKDRNYPLHHFLQKEFLKQLP